MPSQLAVDLSRTRVRAVEIDGSARAPKVKAFVAADVPPPPESESKEHEAHVSYADALREMASQRRIVREPSAVALASIDCTFRDLELPFTSPDQIDRVIKFEAESHLQLVEIDSVVVSYQLLDSDGRGGSRLLAVACAKESIRRILRDLNAIGVDPHFADLHLTALYTALAATGYLAPPAEAAEGAPPSAADRGEVVLVLECDPDLTHLLVARGDTLLAARAIRLGVAPPHASEAGEHAAAAGGEGASAAAHAAGEHGRHDHDETMVVVDDLGGDEAGRAPRRGGGGDYFTRLKREVNRTLFRLGPAAESIARVLVLGRAARDAGFPAFLEKLQAALDLPVEMARPFDQLDHDLDEEELETANAEGAAALGVALRLLGVQDGSRVDFRQEEVRYARRFDQVKVALSCLAIVALVCVALLCIERAKQYRVKEEELFAAASAVLGEYSNHAETLALTQKVNERELTPLQGVLEAKQNLEERRNKLSSDLGRSGSIPRLTSGLEYLNAVVSAIDRNLQTIGRIEINSIDLDAARDDGRRPFVRLRLLLNAPENVDALVAALRSSPAVKEVQTPNTQPAKDGRLEVTNLEIDLKPDYEPRRVAKGASP